MSGCALSSESNRRATLATAATAVKKKEGVFAVLLNVKCVPTTVITRTRAWCSGALRVLDETQPCVDVRVNDGLLLGESGFFTALAPFSGHELTPHELYTRDSSIAHKILCHISFFGQSQKIMRHTAHNKLKVVRVQNIIIPRVENKLHPHNGNSNTG